MVEKNAYKEFVETFRAGVARKTALLGMSDAQIDKIARTCPNKAGKAAIAAYKTKKRFC